MSDQTQGQFRGETKNNSPFLPIPIPGTTCASPVQSNSNTPTSQSGTNHNEGTMSQDIVLDKARQDAPNKNKQVASETVATSTTTATTTPPPPAPYCAVKNTVKRARDAEHMERLSHGLSKVTVVGSEYAGEVSKEFVTKFGEKVAENMVEHKGATVFGAGASVALAAAGPLAITLAICGVLKVVGGCFVDHYGAQFRASHNKWWSSFGDMLLGDKRVTKIMVQAMQAEPCSSMLTELKFAMCSMAANVDAQALAQQGILNVNYQAYTYLKEARDKAMTYLHSGQNGEPMSYVMAARVIMVFHCLCDRRALHTQALVIMEKLMKKDRVKDLIKQANNSRTKDYMSPLGELISFVQMTNECIGMHDVDVGIPDYDAYVICY
jgi:hypothetical protein